ncbi:MAG TPA: DUF6125 family protein [Syntrophorhabdaceae bacterium]|nr:DUF6125 family protein [Syntrophorhabdaceae bacterium]
MSIDRIDLGILKTMDAEGLRDYLEFLLWHYRVVDGFWFLSVEKRFDRASAEHLDEAVWGKIAGMSSIDIAQRFGIKETGLKGFAKAMQFCPWTMIVGYVIEEKSEEVIITTPVCVTQAARVRHGLPEFHCRDMHQREFESFAHGIDENINVECIFAPPDHPGDCFCKWRFTMKERT